jgi:hypothetical protein
MMLEFAKDFRVCFPDMGPANNYIDGMLSLIRKRPVLDIIALDDALIVKHGEYDGSMKEFISVKYGMLAANFVELNM